MGVTDIYTTSAALLLIDAIVTAENIKICVWDPLGVLLETDLSILCYEEAASHDIKDAGKEASICASSRNMATSTLE